LSFFQALTTAIKTKEVKSRAGRACRTVNSRSKHGNPLTALRNLQAEELKREKERIEEGLEGDHGLDGLNVSFSDAILNTTGDSDEMNSDPVPNPELQESDEPLDDIQHDEAEVINITEDYNNML